MKGIELYRKGRGWLPASEDAQKVHSRMDDGEVAWFKPMRIRDGIAFRKYWKLMTVCSEHCERIELPYGGVMLVNNKEDVHTAIKLCTGYCTTIFDAFNKPAFQIPLSTNFEEMTEDEWKEYHPRVLDVVQERVLPCVDIPEVELEILKLMGMAA